MLNNPYYRLQSLDEVRLAATLGVRIDVNQASVDDWLRLPGISIHQARSLVAFTQTGVQFHCLEDIAAALQLPAQRLQPLTPILQFCYYDVEGGPSFQPVNPNIASEEILVRLPGVDLVLARAIIENRQLQGTYRNLNDLQQRLSLPGSTVAKLMHYLRF
jgi:DNA uptake protein ComE-like DNA-binding protein